MPRQSVCSGWCGPRLLAVWLKLLGFCCRIVRSGRTRLSPHFLAADDEAITFAGYRAIQLRNGGTVFPEADYLK
jgi:hypothetical protein